MLTCGTNTDNNVKAHPDVPSLFLTLETVKFTVWIGKLRARLEISLGYLTISKYWQKSSVVNARQDCSYFAISSSAWGFFENI